MKKTLIFTLISALAAMLYASDSYESLLVPFHNTQSIAMLLSGEKEVFAKVPRVTALQWHPNTQKIFIAANSSRFNSTRLVEVHRLRHFLSDAYSNEYEDFENFLANINTQSIEPAISRNDFFWATAIYIRMNKYVKQFIIRNLSDPEKTNEALNNITKNLQEKINERFSDDNLKKLVENYTALFPQSQPLFLQAPPASAKDCQDLYMNCMKSYFELDKYSSVAEFEKWGKNMLDVILFCGDDFLIKEFEKRISNYRKTFKTK